MNALTSIIPSFDPDSPDEHILAAFERVRAARAQIYAFDGMSDAELGPRRGELDRIADASINDEDQVRGNVANTLPGIVAKLLLLIPEMDNAREVDRILMTGGLHMLSRSIDSLDANAKQVAYAALEIIQIEWEHSLAAYEKATADFEVVLRLRGIVEAARLRNVGATGAAAELLRDAAALADALEDRFSNEHYLNRLVQTLTPDHDAYVRKVEIVVAEAFQEEATPWLARDTAYLAGGGCTSAPSKRKGA